MKSLRWKALAAQCDRQCQPMPYTKDHKYQSEAEMNTIKRYDAYMTFSPLPPSSMEKVVCLFADAGLEIQVHENALDFSFEGRDLSDNIVKFFVAAVHILQDADGEIRCEVDDEHDDPHFEFFTISNSKLWRQRGQIVRDESVEVSLFTNSY